MRGLLAVFFVASLVSGCSKTHESETAKKVGEQPKQLLDKVETDVNKALKQGMEQRQGAEKKE